jgi:Tfp pilus assembly protein FimT
VELMVVVAIVVLLAAVVAPNLGGFVAARRVEDAARRLADDLALARNAAIKRNAPVLVCADGSEAGSACAATPGIADWARGWRVCFDVDRDNVCDAGTDANPNPIRRRPAIGTAVDLSAPASRLRFDPDGTLTTASAAPFEFSSVQAGTRRWRVTHAASGAVMARRT